MENKIEVSSVKRALNIFDLYLESDEKELGLTEISKGINVNKSTVYRIVKTLEQEGWLIQNNNKYRIGFGVLKVSGKLLKDYNSRDYIVKELEKLVEKVKETAILSVFEDKWSICIEKADADNSVILKLKKGQILPVHAGAAGKILLAFQPEEVIDKVISYGLKKFNEKTITDGERLKKHLKEIRDRKYAVSYAEVDSSGATIGLPVFNKEGKIIYGLSVSGPIDRMKKKGTDYIINEVKKTAGNISRIIIESDSNYY